ncbi:histidinol phosphate phosphatase domain-containing protein [Hippea maritima]|uniref:PHP domain protein n=1 Tax=Hippea maritima (strain ATCC 700847 / DSM 10411 / MH2) TaxID=760142 RepID=F2LXQ2_HIPMA|nr:histidinol phosphate phosphatase domain-containing protein [Hippea maritima]AEA34293.1 PHP domain protein [Hippea maritima DSM 10411]
MIDLHTHTLFSDGELIPSELARRAKDIGYRAIAFTDHVDFSNMEFVIENVKKAVAGLEKYFGLYVFYGVEITHVPPELIKDAVLKAKELSAQVVVVHGESPVEPVAKGTNLAAIEAGCDILAHPGLINLKEAELAAEKGVYLEISARSGHSFTNGHVFRMARSAGAKYMLNTDTHSPHNLITKEFAGVVLKGCGMNDDEVSEAFLNSEEMLEKLLKRRYNEKNS